MSNWIYLRLEDRNLVENEIVPCLNYVRKIFDFE